jgi:glycosyltransferase involved in cell wall biosynthesis
MTAPQLSICIATYNRAAFIGETLESIISQLTDDVEIVIVDGASTDNTEDVVRVYLNRDERIRYERLPAKGGVDRDFCRAIERARGRYCWLFPDDDLLRPTAVPTVLAKTREGFSLIVVNAQAKTPDFSEILKERFLALNSDVAIGSGDMDQLFERTAAYLSFIGAVVIRRSLWMERNAENYWGTEFVHVGVIFQAPLPGPALLVAEPLITIRYGNAQWTSRAFSIWMIKWPHLLWSFKDVSDRAKQHVMSREPWRNLKEVLYYRAIGAFDYVEFATLLRHNACPWWWKLGALCIAMLPGVVVNTVCRILFSLVRKDSKKMVAYDLTQSRYSLSHK